MYDAHIAEEAKTLIGALQKQGKTLSIAESCTGGMIAAYLTEIPGASAVLLSSLVTYSNQAKMHFLHVKETTLQQYGAVSSQTAIAMAEGALEENNSDIAISTTGIAGPTGGSEEKPVGTVHMAIAQKDKSTEALHYQWSGSREEIRQQAVLEALQVLHSNILTHKAL